LSGRKVQRKIKEQPVVENVIKASAKKIDSDSGMKRGSKMPRLWDTWLPNVNHEKGTFQLSSVTRPIADRLSRDFTENDITKDSTRNKNSYVNSVYLAEGSEVSVRS